MKKLFILTALPIVLGVSTAFGCGEGKTTQKISAKAEIPAECPYSKGAKTVAADITEPKFVAAGINGKQCTGCPMSIVAAAGIALLAIGGAVYGMRNIKM